MNLRTLLSWGMAAMLFAGCSGGTGSSTPSTNNAVPHTPASTSTLSFKIDVSHINQQLQSRRGAQYIGAGVDQIGYNIVPQALGNGNDATAPTYTAVIPLSACTNNSGGSYTCTVNVEANTDYNVGLTTYATISAVETIVGYSNDAAAVGPIGSPVAPVPVLVPYTATTPGAQVPVTLQMVPILNLPLLSVGATTVFYLDGNVQNILLSTNETDKSGNKITTSSGPVIDYPTLTAYVDTAPPAKTAAPGTVAALVGYNATLSATTVAVAPAVPGGYSGNLTLQSSGVAGGTPGSIFLFIGDGITTSTEIEVPFISFSSLASTLTATGLGAANNLTATTTENTTQAAGGGLDTTFSATTDCGAHATIVGPGATTITAATSVSTSVATATSRNALFTITPNDIGDTIPVTPGICTLTVKAGNDANLIDTFTIELPAALNSTITSRTRH